MMVPAPKILPLEVPVKRLAGVVVLALASAATMASAASATKLTGYISDSMCGAKHMGTGAECVKKCIANGMAPVFVDQANKSVWAIDNPAAVKSFYGDHVAVTVSVDEAKKSVHIESIAAAK